MMAIILRWSVPVLLGLAVVTVAAAPKKEPIPVPPVLRFTMKNIDAKPVPLSKYQRNVLLIVNTASQCGNTPQYAGLEHIFKKYKGKGFQVLAFPANNFGGQEPGTNAEIKEFCTSQYKVSFPLFEKISVKGTDKAPLYRYLTEPATNGPFAGEIEWNFAKFLVNREGKVIARFPAGLSPTAPEVVAAIEKALAAPKKPIS